MNTGMTIPTNTNTTISMVIPFTYMSMTTNTVMTMLMSISTAMLTQRRVRRAMIILIQGTMVSIITSTLATKRKSTTIVTEQGAFG